LLSLTAFAAFNAVFAHGFSPCSWLLTALMAVHHAHRNVPIKTILLIVSAENILSFYLGRHAVEF
jgi:hypothetical protein